MKENPLLLVYTSLEYIRGFEDVLSTLEKQTLNCEKEFKKTGEHEKADYQRIIREGIRIAKDNYVTYLERGMRHGAIEELEILDEKV